MDEPDEELEEFKRALALGDQAEPEGPAPEAPSLDETTIRDPIEPVPSEPRFRREKALRSTGKSRKALMAMGLLAVLPCLGFGCYVLSPGPAAEPELRDIAKEDFARWLLAEGERHQTGLEEGGHFAGWKLKPARQASRTRLQVFIDGVFNAFREILD